VHYQRPYVDIEPKPLIFEIGGVEEMQPSIAAASSTSQARIGRATFVGQALARMTGLFGVIDNKMNSRVTQPLGLMMLERGAGVGSLPVSPGNTGISEERVKVRLGSDADITVDGRKWVIGDDGDEPSDDDDDEHDNMDVDHVRKQRTRSRNGAWTADGVELLVKRSQWRLRVQSVSGNPGMEIPMGAVKSEAYSGAMGRNTDRGF
jgi:hypothetical protein